MLLAVLTVAAPIGVGAMHTDLTHEVVDRTKPDADGRMVLREFIDLQCPYCRVTVKTLAPILASRPDIRIERRHVPLPFHDHALEGAVAACCAAEQGAEDKFVDAVVSIDSPPSASVCRAAAEQIGLDLSRFEDCRKSDRPSVRIEADKRLFTETHARGLPTIDLDGERHAGALDEKSAKELFDRHPATQKK
jgi:protein-disulfide isomerase